MTKQRLALNQLIEKLTNDDAVLSIMLYGSLACGKERPNSDIDLFIIRDDGGFRHALDYVDGVKIDYFEATPNVCEALLNAGEAPVINCFLNSIVLYNKNINIDRLRDIAKEARARVFIPIETMPRQRIIALLVQLEDAIDDAEDVLETPAVYRLILSDIITTISNNIFDFWGIWRCSRKEMLEAIGRETPDLYCFLYLLLQDDVNPAEQISAARNLLSQMSARYGGLPKERFILNEIPAEKFGG